MALLAGLIAFRVEEGIMLVGFGLATLAVCYFVIPVINDAGEAIPAGGEAVRRQFVPWYRGTGFLSGRQMLGLTFKARLVELVIIGCI
jgi:hypothetical protein